MATIKVDISDLTRKLQELARKLQNPAGLLKLIAEELLRVARTSFERQRSPEGVPWRPLSEPYATFKHSQAGARNTLQFSGRLFRSLHSGIEGKRAFIQTLPLAYARAHQFGSTHQIPEIKPRRAKALRFFGPGGAPIFAMRVKAHSVTIPARPFLGFPEDAQKRVVEDIEDALVEDFNRGETPNR